MNGDFLDYVVWAIYTYKAIAALTGVAAVIVIYSLGRWAWQSLGIRRLRRG